MNNEQDKKPLLDYLLDGQLVQLTLVRLVEFVREPEAFFWVFGVPLFLAGALGVAFRDRPAETVAVAVVGSGVRARAVLAELEHTQGLRAELDDAAGAADALRKYDVALVVEVQGSDKVSYVYDPTRPDASNARRLANEAVQLSAGRTDPVAATDVHVEKKGSRYIDFLLPGLLGMNLMSGGIGSVCFVIVDMRRRKLLKRLVATPLSRSKFLASFLLSRLVIAPIEIAALLAFGNLAFGVPISGHWAGFVLLMALSCVCFGGVGLLLASRAKTMEAVSGLSNLVMMPMWVFSGVFFSTSNFPSAVQFLARALPLTAVNDALRAFMLRGAPLTSLGPQLAVISAWSVVSYVVALRRFRWS